MSFVSYSAYKDVGPSWLGPLPAHWRVTRFKNALSLRQETVGEKAADFLLLSLTLQGVVPRNLDNPQGKFPASFETYQAVDKDDIVFCLFDVEETPRSVGISRLPGMVTGAYTVTRAKNDFIPEFLFYYYYARDTYKAWRMFYTGLRNVIRWDNFCDIACPQPPRDEQIAVAIFLDRETAKIDALIAEQEKLLALLVEKRQATISHAVTRGLDPEVPMKDSGIAWLGEVPAHWRVIPLKRLATLVTGLTPPTDDPQNYADEGFPWLRPEDIDESGKPSNPSKFLSSKGLDYVRVIPADSVVICCIGTIGKAGVIAHSASTNQQITSAVFYGDSRYFYFATVAARSEMDVAATGNVVRILNSERLGVIRFPVPPQPEQMAIAGFLGDKLSVLDQLRSDAEVAIELLKERRSALIAAAVTGKIDVRGQVEAQAA